MYLGLDLGTSGLKGILIDDEQSVVADATAPLSVSRPQSGWSEQNPKEWIVAAEAVFDALASSTDLSAVAAIGLSGQMHGATLLGLGDEVLRPCMLWNDTRSHRQAAEMDADPSWRDISGNIVFPGFTAPKVAWVADEEAEIFGRVSKVLLPKDYLRLWLTGDHVAEMSDAAGTGWLDTGARDWSDTLLAKSNLARSAMPRLVEGSDVSGTLRPDLAKRWGLGKAVPIAGGGGDNAASAIGMGVVSRGQAFVSLGTSGVLFAATPKYAPAPATAVHTFCHAVPDTWHQMGVILAATDALNWLAGLFEHAPKELTADLGNVTAPGTTLFLPYLGGERTPHNSATARGAFVGLEHATDKSALVKAVLEGVCFALCDCRDALAATGTHIDTLVAVGGGSKSNYWVRALATALGLPVSLPKAADLGAAFGAARLAIMAATGDLSVAHPPEILQTLEPETDLISAFANKHAQYRKAANAVMELT